MIKWLVATVQIALFPARFFFNSWFAVSKF